MCSSGCQATRSNGWKSCYPIVGKRYERLRPLRVVIPSQHKVAISPTVFGFSHLQSSLFANLDPFPCSEGGYTMDVWFTGREAWRTSSIG